MKNPLFLILPLCAISVWQQSMAQDILPDSVVYKRSVASARYEYTKNAGINSYLYNGTLYVHYWNGVRGDPFFLTDSFVKGNLVYAGVPYTEVPLLYDIDRGEVVSKTFSQETDLKLVADKITEFSIGTHVFVRIVPDSVHENVIGPGFYERLYKGTVSVFASHEKKIEQSLRAEDNFFKFTQYDHYYILKDGVFHAIDGEGSIPAVLKDHKAEVRKFLNRRGIRYKKDPAGTLAQVAAFYDQLKK